MTSRRLTWATALGGLMLAILAGLFWRHHRNLALLPPEARYDRLPPAFARALAAARQPLVAHGYDADAMRRLAHLYHANRLYAPAQACYRALAASGLNARDYYYLADIAQQQGDLDAAQTQLRAALALDRTYLPARRALAAVLSKSGADDAAAKEDAAILAAAPDQSQASFDLARLALRAGHDDEAVARLQRLLSVHPEATAAAALLAQIMDRRGNVARAEALRLWSRQRPEPLPADPWMGELMADCYDLQRLGLDFEQYFETGQIAEAVPLLDRVAELDPKSPIPQLLRGWVLARDHHDQAAVAEYREALNKGGDPEKICPYLVESLLTLGQGGEAAALIAHYYALRPDSIPILTEYADVAMRQGDQRLARTLLTKLVQKEPSLYGPNFDLAKLLWAAGEWVPAITGLQRIAAIYPSDVPTRALLGEYLLRRSDPAAAIAPLEQALPLADAHTPVAASVKSMLAVAYRQTGLAAARLGRTAEAVNDDERAIALAPGDPDAYAEEADAWVQARQFARAAEVLTKLANLQPVNPTIFISLGDVLYQAGDSASARRQWQRALQLAEPGAADLRAALARRLAGRIAPDTFQ